MVRGVHDSIISFPKIENVLGKEDPSKVTHINDIALVLSREGKMQPFRAWELVCSPFTTVFHYKVE